MSRSPGHHHDNIVCPDQKDNSIWKQPFSSNMCQEILNSAHNIVPEDGLCSIIIQTVQRYYQGGDIDTIQQQWILTDLEVHQKIEVVSHARDLGLGTF